MIMELMRWYWRMLPRYLMLLPMYQVPLLQVYLTHHHPSVFHPLGLVARDHMRELVMSLPPRLVEAEDVVGGEEVEVGECQEQLDTCWLSGTFQLVSTPSHISMVTLVVTELFRMSR